MPSLEGHSRMAHLRALSSERNWIGVGGSWRVRSQLSCAQGIRLSAVVPRYPRGPDCPEKDSHTDQRCNEAEDGPKQWRSADIAWRITVWVIA